MFGCFKRSTPPRNKFRFCPQVQSLEARDVPSANVVSVAAVSDAAEGSTLGRFRFTRTGDLSERVDVWFSVDGTATFEVDYYVTPAWLPLVFLPGQAEADVLIEAVADGRYDPAESLQVTVSEDDGYLRGADYIAQLTIHDDARHTFTLAGVAGAVWYDINWSDVDATAAEDTAALTNFQLQFGGQTFGPGTPGFSAGNPVAGFAYGELQEIRFDATFADPVAGFSQLAADDGEVTGYYAGGKQPPARAPVQAVPGSAFIVLDFANFGFYVGAPAGVPVFRFPDTAGTFRMRVTWEIAGTTGVIDVPYEAAGTPGADPEWLAGTVRGLLEARGLTVRTDPVRQSRIRIQGPPGRDLHTVFFYTRDTYSPDPIVVASGAGAPSAIGGQPITPSKAYDTTP